MVMFFRFNEHKIHTLKITEFLHLLINLLRSKQHFTEISFRSANRILVYGFKVFCYNSFDVAFPEFRIQVYGVIKITISYSLP